MPNPNIGRSTSIPISILALQKTNPKLYYFEQTYQYITKSTSVSANGSNTVIFPVDANYDFVACRISYVASISHSGAQPTFDFMLKANDKQFMQNPVNAECFPGIFYETAAPTRVNNGLGIWFEFKRHLYFPAKSDINLVLYDTSGYTNTITFILDGYKREKSEY